MQKHFFWLEWEQPYKLIASFLFVLLLMLITASMVMIAIGSDGLIDWHTFSQKVPVEVITESVNVGPFSFPFTEHYYLIKEFSAGGEMPNTAVEKQVVFIGIMLLFGLILTLITYFNRFGFILFSSLIFFFIIFLHPEMLGLFDVKDVWILGGMFLIYIGPAYFLQAFYKDSSFISRLLILSSIVVGSLLVVIWQSKFPSPLNAFFSYGILGPYIVVLLFVLIVGHEILNGFAIAIAGSKDEPDNNRIKHFVGISFIYLLNVLLSYLQITHVINWNFISINPIILLAIAAVLGVWGISQRFILYKKVNSFQQVWVMFYLALAVMSFATITFLLYSMEDPMLKIITDFIIFSQLALGTAFLIYIVYNFSSIIEKGHSIKDIVFQPTNLPHTSSKLVGMLILTALVLMRDIKYPLWYSLGGFYNSIASYFEDQDNNELATVFYEKGADLSKNNHKSNYKLGMIHIDSDHKEAIERFDNATTRYPSAQAFINKANLESDDGAYFDALFTLQKGAETLSSSIEVKSNLGLQFSKANMLDSAWHYYSTSKESEVAKNNALAFVLENNLSISGADSAFLFSNLNRAGAANAAALGIIPTDLSALSGDNMISGTLLHNALVNQLIPYSEVSYNSILSVVDSTYNPIYAEELNYALALYEIRNERITDALLRLQKLTSYGSDMQSTYFETLGLINMKYGSYNEAETFFLLASDAKQITRKSYLLPLALAQSEGGYFDDAIITWSKVIKKTDIEEEALKASVMIQVLNSIIHNNDSIIGDDISLYLKARYQRLWVDEYSVRSTVKRIADKSIKNQIALDLATYYFDAGNEKASKLFYDIIDPVENDEVIQPLLKFNIRMAYAGTIPNLDKQLVIYEQAGFEFEKSERLQKAFYETNRKEISDELAESLATDDPYFAEGVVWAASHFGEDEEDAYKSYTILQEALDKNPDNRILLEAYILKAFDIGMDEYATNSMQHYRELFPGDQFNKFQQVALERKAKFDEWIDEKDIDEEEVE